MCSGTEKFHASKRWFIFTIINISFDNKHIETNKNVIDICRLNCLQNCWFNEIVHCQ